MKKDNDTPKNPQVASPPSPSPSPSSLYCGGAEEPEDILNWIGSKLEPLGFVRKP